MVEPDGTIHHGDDIPGEQERERKNQNPSAFSIPKNRSTGNLLAYSSRNPFASEKNRIRFSTDAGVVTPGEQDRGRKSQHPSELLIPKNRSTGNLLAYSSRNPSSPDKSRICFSADAGLVSPGEHDSMLISPVFSETEDGLNASGLQRVRHHPLTRAPTIPPSESSSRNTSLGPRSASMTTLSLANSRSEAMAMLSGPSSPTLNFPEDLSRFPSHAAMLTAQLKAAARKTAAKLTGRDSSAPLEKLDEPENEGATPTEKKTIDDFVILEEMGQGAYGQVKLARYKKNGNRKMVLKYVTKRRILVDTWTRDRKLGTVPLEIHVLDYLRREGLKHLNIVEMNDFFEDDINYYIEFLPHGLPGMDLFDYIELRANMEENECRSIFVQVANAIHHLHTKAFVVHRDIKDENVVLDGEGNIKLIDFGSAAYIKNGPFDVFVGTIDYAAPEVLSGKSYRGKEQDVWALGILLYTIIYKENPFYSIDEIMDRDLRIPFIMSEGSIVLIRRMLDRNVDSRITIEQILEHPWCQTPQEED